MVKKTKGKHRLDKYYYLAKEQGFRSRAAFKLVQLNRKYHFLEKSRTLLDLCAAPGGWLQVAVKHMPMSSLIVGVDLVPIRPIRGAKTIIGDITSAQCRQALEKLAGGSLMDAVIHDGAPNIGGAWASESASQTALALQALRLATFFMAPKATFVSKVFRSQDYNAFLYALNQLFDKVVATKPAASRNASAEIFVVCLGYKAPAKIDARLLDPKHLFQEVTEAAPVSQGPDALLRTKMMKKRHREGYEEGVSVMHKPTSVAAFLAAKDPVSMLGQFSRFELEGAASEPGAEVEDGAALAEIARTHEGTNDEIRQLCRDLQVLGRSEFKQLIKWRIQLKRDFSAAKAKATGDVEVVEETEEERAKVVSLVIDGLLSPVNDVEQHCPACNRGVKCNIIVEILDMWNQTGMRE
ncbi:hypothetical protein WJX84_009032 [Apatococcus fuscideae]|uniref:Uncharacterized protein n=1 Tax=Apatococcus fuscideae TaxID=2026836 RepID=A0AAW1TF98_9CHLO